MRIRVFIRGLLAYLPFLLHLFNKGRGSKGTGGTNSAIYCYSVWMRHLKYLSLQESNDIKRVAELGPGDSIGIGLAAVISGANEYYAFDVIQHANVVDNLRVFDELVSLFKNKTEIPAKEFPGIKPKLDDYSFPHLLLPDEKLQVLLSETRVNSIREAIKTGNSGNIIIRYIVPWDERLNENLKVDLILSQAVMEHIQDVGSAYHMMYKWLSPSGLISHTIDYSAHETHKTWNGHWSYSSFSWAIIMKGRSYLINRLPHSEHIKLITDVGFKISFVLPFYDLTGISASSISKKIIINNKEDIKIRSSYIIARKSEE